MTLLLRDRFSIAIQRAIKLVSFERTAVLKIGVFLIIAYVFITAVTAVSTFRAVDSISSADVGVVLTSGDSGVDELEEKLAVFDRRFELLKFWLLPVRYTARIVILVPPLERERKSAELILERAEVGADAAKAALKVARSSFALQESGLSGSISLSDAEKLEGLRDELTRLNSDSLNVTGILSESKELKSEIDKLSPNRVFVAIGRQMSDQEDHLAEIAEFSELLSIVLLSDISLVEEMNDTFADLSGFSNGDVSVTEISSSVSALSQDLKIVREKAIRMVQFAPDSVLNSEYGNLVNDLRDLNIASSGLIESLDTILGTFSGLFDRLASSEKALFGDGGPLVDTLQSLISNEEEISGAITSIQENANRLKKLDESGSTSLGTLGDVLNDRLDPLLELSSLLSGAPAVMGEVIGIDDETRNYLVLGQTSDELRAAGGFTSSAWLLTFESGVLAEKTYVDIATLEDLDSLDEYPDPPEALRLHMNANRIYMRDVGWDPNFPTVGRLAIDLFEVGRDIDVDGVIAITQWAFVDLTSALGGIETESGFLSGEDVLSTIVEGTDDDGTVYLSSVFDSLLDSLTGEAVKSNSIGLLRTMDSLFASKDLMIYSENSEVQSLISDMGWGGAFVSSGTDRLAIVDSNVGWNKVDRKLVREFSYRVDLSDLSNPSAQLQLSYRNDSVSEENICDIQTHVGGFYRDLLDGCYWNFLRVYIPAGAELEPSDLLPLEPGSIASRVGLNAPGSRTVRLQNDDNGFYISGLLAVNPKETREVTLAYSLPRQVVHADGEIAEYSLDIVVQAGVRNRTGVVSIVLPDGYEIVDAGNSVRIASNVVEFTVQPERDDVIRLTLKQNKP
jgi:hypothetical protein